MNEKIGLIIREFTASLKIILSDNLLAIVLYGSAAGGAYCEGVSDINVLVILEKNNTAKLFSLGRTVKTLLRKHRISPRIMTREEFITATDVFPLEYCDILETHELVYGNGEILDITVERENLRLQLEEKLRGAVGDIHGMIIAAGGNEKLLQKLFLNWSALGGVLFRGLLRLKGKSVTGLDAETAIAETEKEYKVSLEGFSVLNRLRRTKKIRPLTASSLADMLLEPLSTLVHEVDAMNGEIA